MALQPHRNLARRSRGAHGAALLAGLLTLLLAGSLLVGPAAPARAGDWGRLEAKNGVLRKGCQNVVYRYRLTPPEGDWALETFLTDRRGRRVASGVLMSGQDPPRGKDRFRICRWSTVPGRFRITALLTVQNGPREYTEGWLKSTRFRLRKR